VGSARWGVGSCGIQEAAVVWCCEVAEGQCKEAASHNGELQGPIDNKSDDLHVYR